ncbi:MAG TPA: vitamin K epoxide reductase family protein [Anaeromyxobacter sp.]|nr:vitamin K epoxide reductase family protein [Anaeromyxobacter sp.]
MPNPSRTRPQPRATPEAAPASRALPLALLVLALAGVGVAIYLWLVHEQAKTGGSASCDINATVNCSDVARSKYAVFLGVPIAAWGGLVYLAMAGLAASALGRRRPSASWPGGLSFALAAFMSAGAVVLAYISHAVLDRFCVACAVSWAISFGLLALTIPLVRRAGGVGAALGADLAALGARRGAAWGGAAALAAAAIALVAIYARPAPPPAPRRSLQDIPRAVEVIPVGAPGSLVIYEYSDYLCPACAMMHADERSILAARPDVRFVRRHYPLDNTCNLQLQRQIHAGACALARGGICAEKMGRFDAYDDLAFAQQASRPSPEALAQQLGLDPGAFQSCMASPETEQRLASDIDAAGRAGVQFTPALDVNGKIHSRDTLRSILGLPRAP